MNSSIKYKALFLGSLEHVEWQSCTQARCKTCIYFLLYTNGVSFNHAIASERNTMETQNLLGLGKFVFHVFYSPLKTKVSASTVIMALHTYKQVQISLPLLPLFCLCCCKQKDIQLRHG